MNFESPKLTTAWHFGVPSQTRGCGVRLHCHPWNSMKWDHVLFPQTACGRVFCFLCFNRDSRLEFSFSQLIPKLNKRLFYGDLKNVRDSLVLTWFRAWSTPSSLREPFASCCFDFVGTAKPLQSLALASSLQWSLWASELSVFNGDLVG